MVVSSDGGVVVGLVVDGVGDGVVVVAEGIVVDVRVVAGAGALPPLSRARVARP